MSPTLSVLLILLFPMLANSQNFSLTFDFEHRNLLTYWTDAAQNSDHIELTYYAQNSISRVYYTDPVHLFDSTNSSQLLSFSTSFTFQIVQSYVVESGYYYPPGDGMAFIMSPNNTGPPYNSSGGFLSLLNSSLNGDSRNHLLAIEFDTFQNSEFQDLPEAHIGINVNNLTSLLAVVPPDDLKLSKNLTLTAWIDYMAASNLLQVRLSTSTTKPEIVMLNLTIDLSKVVKETMYVGFSASTGSNYYELHKLYSWNFSTSNSSISAAISPVAPSSSRAPPPLMLNAKKKNNILVPVIAALPAALICISLLVLGWMCYKKRKMEASTKEIQLPITRFTYTQLKAATKNFSPEEMLGKGAFGKVYKGVLADGNTVAVKLLFQETTVVELQLVAELSVISHLRHRNLLSLTGWCYTKEKLLLVYDYMSNGNLHNYLFDTSKLLSWQQRYDIVLGVAEGLAYLHTGWEQKIVHRDVKASNVLLDSNFRAHLGDFGLAKLLDYDKTEQTMTTAGTFGYIAPELVYTGKASDKSDVYSFGILILEVASGRKVLDTMQGKFLLEWIWLKNEECKLLDVADPKLKMSFDSKEMKTILLLGLLCCQEDPRHRPSMRKCCNILKGSEPLPQMQSLVYINSNQSASVSTSSSSPLCRTQPNSVLGILDDKQ